jgi:hypothetical protein
MTKLELPRRKFLGTFAALLAAPSIVPYRSLMPVKLVRWIERPRGIQRFESYPWVATIDYDTQDPFHIDLDQIDIKCLYTPPDLANSAFYDDSTAYRTLPASFKEAQPLMTLEELKEANSAGFPYVTPEELPNAVPKVIKHVLKSTKA